MLRISEVKLNHKRNMAIAIFRNTKQLTKQRESIPTKSIGLQSS
jgi:hypothetical protein